ncbi:MAG: DNA methyltransferase [Anaerolineae bacterium]
MNNRKAELTFKPNLRLGRHGWLRLTPAYSVNLVNHFLDQRPEVRRVLEPFCGTGTTPLVCAQRGIACHALEINPFLVWLARAKTANYSNTERETARNIAHDAARCAESMPQTSAWVPPIANIERWWREDRLLFLARLRQSILERCQTESKTHDLLMVAFCRLLIECSNAAFNHQSMSFKQEQAGLFDSQESGALAHRYEHIASEIITSAEEHVPGYVGIMRADARQIPAGDMPYDAVITSPPYPNRMSYIRELRPYMYWMGFLSKAREASELDWQAIGGTWGAATSRLQTWAPNGEAIHINGFSEMIQRIARHSALLANYVHKYFVDISQHLASVRETLAPGASVFYVVGNSKFYDTLVPVETLYAEILERLGFIDVAIAPLRKRNSKKELIEFAVSGRKPV